MNKSNACLNDNIYECLICYYKYADINILCCKQCTFICCYDCAIRLENDKCPVCKIENFPNWDSEEINSESDFESDSESDEINSESEEMYLEIDSDFDSNDEFDFDIEFHFLTGERVSIRHSI